MTWLTVKQVAARLGAAIPTVTLWLRQGRFPNAIAAGAGRRKVWLVPEADVDAFQRPTPGYPKGRPRK